MSLQRQTGERSSSVPFMGEKRGEMKVFLPSLLSSDIESLLTACRHQSAERGWQSQPWGSVNTCHTCINTYMCWKVGDMCFFSCRTDTFVRITFRVTDDSWGRQTSYQWKHRCELLYHEKFTSVSKTSETCFTKSLQVTCADTWETWMDYYTAVNVSYWKVTELLFFFTCKVF